MDYAERKMRAGIAAIPDGTYRFEDWHDNPEVAEQLKFSTVIEVRGDEMHLHFDAPPQVRAGMNMTYTALLSTVYYAVKTLVDPTIPPNAGLARPLHVTAPEGTVVNCVSPAAVNGRLGACQRVVDLVHGALAGAMPDQVIAATNGACASVTFVGAFGDGTLWVYLETIGGGSGARRRKDGLDGVHVHMTNTSNLPVEALEGEYPLTLLRYELVDGSGGEGRQRGGHGGCGGFIGRSARAGFGWMGRGCSRRPLGAGRRGAGGAGELCVQCRGGAVRGGAWHVACRRHVVTVITAGGGGVWPVASTGDRRIERRVTSGRGGCPIEGEFHDLSDAPGCAGWGCDACRCWVGRRRRLGRRGYCGSGCRPIRRRWRLGPMRGRRRGRCRG